MPYNIGPRIYIDGEKEFRQSIKNINNELKTLDNYMEAASAKFDKNQKSVQALTEKQGLLKEKSEKLEEALEKVRKAIDNLDENSEKYKTQLAQLEKQESEYIAELEKTKKALNDVGGSLDEAKQRFVDFSNQMQAASAKFEKIGNTLTSVGNKLTMSLTLPITALGTLALKSSTEFEQAFTGVRKTVDATEAQFRQLSNAAIEMSKTMPESANEIAAVMESAGQMGIATEKIEDFTKVMVMLGDTTDISSQEAAMSLARLVNVMNTSQDDFDNLGSTIVDLGNNFAATESEIVDTAQRISAAGKQVGASESDILGFATAMRAIGLESEAGGTAISKTMMNIRVACETGGEALEQYAAVAGMSAEQFKQAFEKDAAQAVIAFVDGLNNINESGGSAIVTLTEMGITEVRLRNALLSLSSGSDTLKSAVETANIAWKENNALQTEAEKRYATTESQLSMLKNNATALAISFGDAMLPALNNVIESLGDFVDWLASLDTSTKETLIRIAAFLAVSGPVTRAFGGIANVISSVTKGLSGLSKQLIDSESGLSKLVAKISGASGVQSALSGLASVFGSAAAGAGVLGIAVAALSIPLIAEASATKKAKEALKEYRDVSDECIERDKELIIETRNLTKSLDISMNSIMANGTVAYDLNKTLQELVATQGDTAEGQAEIKQKVDLLNETVPGLNLTYDAMTNSLSLTNAEIEKNIDNMVEQAKVAAQKQVLEDYFNQLYKNRAEMEKHAEATDTAKENLTQLYAQREYLEEKMRNQQQGTNGISGFLLQEMEELNEQIQEQEDIIERSKQSYDELANNQLEFSKNTSALAQDLGISAESVSEFATEAQNGMTSMNNAITDCKDTAAKDFETLKSKAEELKNKLTESFKSAGKESNKGYIQGLDKASLGEHAALTADEVATQFKKQLGIQSPSKVFYEIGEYTIEGLFNSFKDAEWKQLTDFFVGAIVEGAEAGTLSINKLVSAIDGVKNIGKLTAYASGLGYDIAGLFGSPGGGYTGSGWSFPSDSKLITDEFGYRESPGGIGSTYHQGLDIGAAYGSPIYAAQAGTISLAGDYGGYGTAVIIDHGSGLQTLYGHMSALGTSYGDSVTQGQIIGYVGSTGNSTGPHLHFSVLEDGVMVDPRLYLGSFAKGTHYLPKDGIIMAHEGEAVIPKSQNPWANGYNGNTYNNTSDTSYNIVNNFTQTNQSPAQIARRMKQTVKQLSRKGA